MGTLRLSNAGGHSAGRADYTHWGPGSISRIEGYVVPVVGHADYPVERVAAELDVGFGEWEWGAVEAGLAG